MIGNRSDRKPTRFSIFRDPAVFEDACLLIFVAMREAAVSPDEMSQTERPEPLAKDRSEVEIENTGKFNSNASMADLVKSGAREIQMKLKALATMLFLVASSNLSAAQSAPQMRLIDDLGYSGEGYCIDVVGVGDTARADLPLVVHNCLPSRNSADRVAVERDGRIFMPAFGACVTAFGVNGVLPGSPVVLRPCGVKESFLPADQLQRFERTGENRLRLRGTDLCLVAGADTDRTFSARDRWRTLTMQDCATSSLAQSAWK